MSENWLDKYRESLDNPPEVGSTLSTIDWSKAKLIVQLEPGKDPFIYGLAYVPSIVDGPIGWFLVSEIEDKHRGWKCVLLPRSRSEAIKNCKIEGSIISIQSLKIVQYSTSGKCLLCEISEY